MNGDDIITLSSDEESKTCPNKFLTDILNKSKNQELSSKKTFNEKIKILKHYAKSRDTITIESILGNVSNNHRIKAKKRKRPLLLNAEKLSKKSKAFSPEVVDLVDCTEVSTDSFNKVLCLQKKEENNSILNCLNISEVKNISLAKWNEEIGDTNFEYEHKDSSLDNKNKNSIDDKICIQVCNLQNSANVKTDDPNVTQNNILTPHSSQIGFYDEFVNLCLSYEKISGDKVRLSKKLYKRFKCSDPKYTNSEEFKALIEKCTSKLNEKNLYLIAKEVADELSSRKKINIQLHRPTGSVNTKKEVEENDNNEIKYNKKTKLINKIMKKLDLLGHKIRKLEETEVDLSDEEESAYVQLQRYRYRFCLIYKKLCQYTNELSDADRIYCRKICFSGSKYPKINKCIEQWLNKTKRFPDFTDIMKLLENESSNLGLPSNHESVRAIAMEIFQQVGIMLQERRKYDLWDSFFGFLNESEDPAIKNPELEKVLKENFETRIKKEQEIFAHYAELQEKQKLKAEEVPEEVANLSPPDSGNEDEEELEAIEESINEKFDGTIENESTPLERKGGIPISLNKESKNNYKNCKSLKWRERKNKLSDKNIGEFSQNSVDSTFEGKINDEERDTVCEVTKKSLEKDNSNSDVKSLQSNSSWNNASNEAHLKFSKVPIIQLRRISEDLEGVSGGSDKVPLKVNPLIRKNISEIELPNAKKRNILSPISKISQENEINRIGKEDKEQENDKDKNNKDKKLENLDCEKDLNNSKRDIIVNSVFEVRYCLLEHFDNTFFGELCYKDCNNKKKNQFYGKAFRDLTNISHFLRQNRMKNKRQSGWTPTFYNLSVHGVRPYCAKKHWINFRCGGVKLRRWTSSHEDKTDENYKKEKNFQKNTNTRLNISNIENNIGSSNRNGSKGDSDENDKSKKNIKKTDIRDSKFENDDRDEDEESSDFEKISEIILLKSSYKNYFQSASAIKKVIFQIHREIPKVKLPDQHYITLKKSKMIKEEKKFFELLKGKKNCQNSSKNKANYKGSRVNIINEIFLQNTLICSNYLIQIIFLIKKQKHTMKNY